MERQLRRRSACFCAHLSLVLKFDLIKKSNSGIRHFHIAHFNTLCFTFLLGFLPREIENNDFAKFLGGKQIVLWAMWEWQIDKSKERVRSRGHCPSFRLIGFVYCSVRSLHGSRETADDVHMVSGCTVAPMAYFYIVVFQIFLKSSQ